MFFHFRPKVNALLLAADWMEIKTNNMVVVTPKMNLLQIPIVDKFYVPPSDPASLTRTTEFAREKGLLVPRTNNIDALDGKELS
jgi:glutamine amidotransferase